MGIPEGKLFKVEQTQLKDRWCVIVNSFLFFQEPFLPENATRLYLLSSDSRIKVYPDRLFYHFRWLLVAFSTLLPQPETLTFFLDSALHSPPISVVAQAHPFHLKYILSPQHLSHPQLLSWMERTQLCPGTKQQTSWTQSSFQALLQNPDWPTPLCFKSLELERECECLGREKIKAFRKVKKKKKVCN